ncbi:DUF4349 domain-containing protein [Asaia siamensis]
MMKQKIRYSLRRLAGPVVLGVVLASLAGCKHRHGENRRAEMSYGSFSLQHAPSPIPAAMRFSMRGKVGQGNIAYEHSLALRVSADKVGAHLATLRDYCLAQQGCELVSASEDAEDQNEGSDNRSARLSARLPHDKVEDFLKIAAAPLAGETVDAVVTQSLRTSERDLNREVTDVDRRLAQMTAYRDRLEVLEAQSAGKTDDLIKVAKELSEAQSTLERALKEKKDLSRQVDTEEVDVTYRSARENLGPLRQRWKDSGALFSETLADLWDFLIQAVVWAPLAIIGLLIVRRAIRRGWFSRP